MNDSIHIDSPLVNDLAQRLGDAADQLGDKRPQFLTQLANGDGIRPTVKAIEDIKVTIGIPPFDHSGSRAGEIVAHKIRVCGDAYAAAEEGLRAMGTVMARMVGSLSDSDSHSSEQLETLLAGLHRVAVVTGDGEPEPVDWFGLGMR